MYALVLRMIFRSTSLREARHKSSVSNGGIDDLDPLASGRLDGMIIRLMS